MRPALVWAILWMTAGTACAGEDSGRERVLLVTTTSVEASGLLDDLLDAYHGSQDRYQLSTTAVGSGAALEIGRRGDADVLLTHDPGGERRFMEDGYGAERSPVMMNSFVITGPPSDPAGVRELQDPVEALARIAGAEARFLSRGDDSGTHRKERALWTSAGLQPWATGEKWYIEAGSGMGEMLQMANQMGAYALTDGASYRYMRDQLDLDALSGDAPALENHYSVILPTRPPNPGGARDLVQWLTGPGQELIAGYGVDLFGEPLFRPADPPVTAIPAG